MSEESAEMAAALLERVEKLEERVSKLEGVKKRPSGKSDGSSVFDSYAEAYFGRYSVPPIRNAATNTQASLLVGRVGKEDAVLLVAFYVKQNDPFYTRANHPLSFCLKDCEGLMTRMRTGIRTTSAMAKALDDKDSNTQATKAYLNKKHAEKQEEP